MTMITFVRSGAARVAASYVLASTLLGGGPAGAAEIHLLSAASMQTVLREIIGDFERTSGHKVTIRYSTMGAITERILGGEETDLVISSPASISSLVTQGRINAGSERTIAKTVLAAKTIVYANPAGGGAAGIHIARVIEKLGIAEQLKPKTKFGAGGDVTEVTLAEGDGALGMTQVSEIVGKPGAEFVPLPDELQNYTGFTAGTPPGAKQAEAVAAFIKFLKSPAATATMQAKGMQLD